MLSSSINELSRTDGLVVPGVGAFSACMDSLAGIGAVEFITQWVGSGRPVLGICVGHQVLFHGGTEHGLSAAGVGVFPGSVDPLPVHRLPHMGWNRVEVERPSRLFLGLEQAWFYFVHSYAAQELVPDAMTHFSEHEGIRFVAAVERGNVMSTQFHPEKSGQAGAMLLRNWLEIVRSPIG